MFPGQHVFDFLAEYVIEAQVNKERREIVKVGQIERDAHEVGDEKRVGLQIQRRLHDSIDHEPNTPGSHEDKKRHVHEYDCACEAVLA